MMVVTALVGNNAGGTAAADYREGINEGDGPLLMSLYDSQLARRLALR